MGAGSRIGAGTRLSSACRQGEGQRAANEPHFRLDAAHALDESREVRLAPCELPGLHRDDDTGRGNDGSPSLHVSPIFVARAPRRRGGGTNALKRAEVVADTSAFALSKREGNARISSLEEVRPVTAATLGARSDGPAAAAGARRKIRAGFHAPSLSRLSSTDKASVRQERGRSGADGQSRKPFSDIERIPAPGRPRRTRRPRPGAGKARPTDGPSRPRSRRRAPGCRTRPPC